MGLWFHLQVPPGLKKPVLDSLTIPNLEEVLESQTKGRNVYYINI